LISQIFIALLLNDKNDQRNLSVRRICGPGVSLFPEFRRVMTLTSEDREMSFWEEHPGPAGRFFSESELSELLNLQNDIMQKSKIKANFPERNPASFCKFCEF